MITSRMWRLVYAGLVAAMFLGLGSLQAGDPDPKALAYKLPKQLNWTGNPSVQQNAILYGDPTKPGLYIVLTKWMPHNMSRPHSHPNDRYITVISGTWWVGTGTKYDPESTFPIPAGSFVTHFGKETHYDGAKDAEVL